jgi:hypothetical protein
MFLQITVPTVGLIIHITGKWTILMMYELMFIHGILVKRKKKKKEQGL